MQTNQPTGPLLATSLHVVKSTPLERGRTIYEVAAAAGGMVLGRFAVRVSSKGCFLSFSCLRHSYPMTTRLVPTAEMSVVVKRCKAAEDDGLCLLVVPRKLIKETIRAEREGASIEADAAADADKAQEAAEDAECDAEDQLEQSEAAARAAMLRADAKQFLDDEVRRLRTPPHEPPEPLAGRCAALEERYGIIW